MATGNGILRKMSGSVGDLTYRVVNGQQTVAAKATHVKNPRTEAQMNQRSKWCNLVAMYRVGSQVLKDAFENKSGKQSDFNRFMAVNLAAAGVYLTKKEFDQGACIAAPYTLTQGSLAAIQITGSGEDSVTDLALGSLTIGASTTVAELTAAILNNNDDWMEGDQLSFLLYKQSYNDTLGIPQVVCQKFKMTLSLTDTTQVLTIFPACACDVADGYLAIGSGLPQGAFAWIHSRKSSSKTLVSTQHLQLYNDLYENYYSDSARSAAIESYGVSADAFLTPGETSSTTVVAAGGSDDNDSDSGAGSGTGDDNGNTGGSDTGGSSGGTTPDDDETI